MHGVRGLGAFLGLGIIAQVGCFAAAALAGSLDGAPLQIYGLALDKTRLGSGFCERRAAGQPVRRECGASTQSLREITDMDVQTTPGPHVRLGLALDSGGRKREVRIWYAPREEGGQSFMITTATYHDLGLDSVRDQVHRRSSSRTPTWRPGESASRT